MPLQGRTILVLEDQALIALGIEDALRDAGAKVSLARTVKEAEVLVERDDLSSAVLDYKLGDGDSTPICTRLAERTIPFVIYTAYPRVEGACEKAPIVVKPGHLRDLVATVAALPRT